MNIWGAKMDKYSKILYYMNKYGFSSQRELAGGTELSLGLVNNLLKELLEKGLVSVSDKGRKKEYALTKEGKYYLERTMLQFRNQKLSLSKGNAGVHQAVILAAGQNKNFDVPVGLLKIDGMALIEHMIRCLDQYGVTDICVVVGSQKEQYESYFQNRKVTLVENERFKWTGTMASLACAKEFIQGDFLLIDGNQIFEEAAIRTVLDFDHGSCVLLTSPSGSSDEAYVELDRDGSLFRISKDIRQMNHVDAELVGITKITYPLFQKMLEIFSENSNPFINYEYILENIARIYQIFGCHTDDLIWCVVENEELYHRVKSIIYPRIKKKVILQKENRAKETLKECLHIEECDIQNFRISGGMTNTNFYVRLKDREYILRIPGACTDKMVDRKSEQHNSALASFAGFNPNSIYFNPDTGVKITEYIPDAETLNGKTARLEKNIKKTTALLKSLHQSHMKMYNDFSVQTEYEKYKNMLNEVNVAYYHGFSKADAFFYHLMDRLETLGMEHKPCHNDLVAENLIKDKEGKMYLIDWEYSGYHDPMWDLASHLLECEFTEDEEELFLYHYFGQKPDAASEEKIMIFKICQDILWSAWTILKEAQGEDFGTYGIDRLNRGLRLIEEYKEKYEKR